MVGYSRLMEADERGTLARLRTHRLELLDPTIAKNNGRIIKTAGDGMLVEFQSVIDAVQAQQVRELVPRFSIRRHLATLHYRQESDREHLRGGLLAAGLPE
jgi:class 3 adenylate cyclase